MVLEEIGAGGMGVVYAAYDPELDRQVALKVLPASNRRDGEEARLRLIREAQALAKVVHPNVVAVHDVGSVDRQVFLAMELVKGVDLAAWLLDEGRDWRETVTQFVEAGRGLAAVHAAGLAHRDFKPSNVRVGEDGRVRVLDFDLAQGAQGAPEAGEHEPREDDLEPSLLHRRLTQEGRVFGTPRYMAPEQHLGKRADARSDQFAFCVALWESLYGEHPFARDGSTDLLEAVERGPGPPQGEQRVPAGIQQALIRGLKSEPDERFPSMDDLLATLSRHSESRRRWLWPVLIAAITSGLIAYGLWREPPCASGAGKLVGVWDDTVRAQTRLAFQALGPAQDSVWQATADNLDDFADRWQSLYVEVCEATHVRQEQSSELLDLRMACLEERRRELGTLAELFTEADDALAARAEHASSHLSSLAACSDVRRLTLPVSVGDEPGLKEEVARIRGRMAEARALGAAGRRDRYLAVTEEAEGEARATGYAPLIAEVKLELGAAHYRASRPDPAEAAYLDARHFADAGRHDVVRAEALNGLLWLAGDGRSTPEETDRRLREARGVIERLDDDPRLLIRWQQANARVLRARGRLQAAAEAVASAIDLSEQLYGPDHPDTASMITTLGTIQAQKGQFQGAIDSFERALEARRAHLRPDHPDIGSVQQQLANILLQLGRYEQAADYLKDSLHISGDQKTTHRARVLADLGYAEVRLGRDAKGIEHMRQSLELWLELRGDGSAKVAEMLNYLGDSYLEICDLDAAEQSLRRATEIYRSLGRPALPPTINLARALVGLGRHAEAAGLIRDLRQRTSPGHYLTPWIDLVEGELFAARAEPDRALARFEHVREQWLASDQTSPLDLALVHRRTAEALIGSTPDRARIRALEALELYRAQGAAGRRGAEEVEAWLATHGSNPR